MIESLLANRPAWIQLGLVLAHFLWQGAAIAVVLAAMLWFLRRRSPNTRYGLCGLAMLTMAACPVLTLQYVRTHPLPLLAEPRPAAVISRTTLPDEPDVLRSDPADAADPAGNPLSAELPGRDGVSDSDKQKASGSSASSDLQAIGEREPLGGRGDNQSIDDSRATTASPTAGLIMRLWLPRGLELAALAWLIGVAVLSVRLVIGWLRLRRRYRRDTEGLPEAIEAVVRRLSERLGFARRVRVVAARAWNEPIAFGLLRPVVLMPVAMLTQCPVELIEAMIAHELAHIRRYDLWVNVFQRVVETVLFYHPAVWWVSGRMRLERELCCDDLAIHATGRRADYASALVELCRVQPGLVTPALAAGVFGPKLSLLTRVRRVLQASPLARESNRGRFWLAGPLSILLAGGFVFVAGIRGAASQGAENAASPPLRAEPQAFVAELPSGATIELVGIHSYDVAIETSGTAFPPKGKPGWRPDGTVLEGSPYDRFDSGGAWTGKNRHNVYDFVIRLTGLAEDAEPKWEPVAEDRFYGGGSIHKGRVKLEGFRVRTNTLPKELERTDLRLGIPNGEWQTLTSFKEQTGIVGDYNEAILVEQGDRFQDVSAEPGEKLIQITHSMPNRDARVVAVDASDCVHVSSESGLQSSGNLLRFVGRFPDLPWDQIKEFRLQYRPYQWVEFKNVSLRPGHRTAVQVEITSDRAGSSQAGSPAAAPSASESSLPFPKKTYAFKWERVPFPKVLAELQEQTGLSVVGADDIEKTEDWTISFASIRPVGFDEALLLINHLIQDKGVGYWILRRDQCLEIRDVVSWFRRVPPAQMFTTEEAYQKADLPKWEVASVVYQPRHASANPLAGRANDQVPDNTARAVLTPDGNRIELKGIVEYIDQQLEIIKKWDVPQGEFAVSIGLVEKAAESGKRRLSFSGKPPEIPDDSFAAGWYDSGANPGTPRSVPVHAMADGLITEAKVKNGQTVKKGDLLVQLDVEEIKLEKEAALVRYDQAQEELARLAKLTEHNAVGQFEYRKVAADAKLAQIEVRRLDLRLSRTRITSPADGKLRAAEGNLSDLVGKRVTAGDPLLYIEPADSAPQANTRPSDSSPPDERPRRGRSPDEGARGRRF